jgi:hypothetical protein
MEQGAYKVVLSGEIIEGYDREQVVAQAARLFKCPPAQAERLLQGRPTSLKRQMDEATAGRYRDSLTKSGIACRLEPVNAQPVLETTAAEQRPEPASGGASLSLTPKEGTENTSPIRLELSDEPQVADTPARNKVPASTTAASASGFQCPKCGTPQERGSECVKCGIIFAKYQPSETPVADAAEEAEESTLDEWDELALFVGENMDAYRGKFRQLQQNEGRFQWQWHWAAFAIPVPWLIYRKLYFWAVAYVLISLLVPPIAMLAVAMVPGLLGNYVYYRHARQRIAKMTSSGDERRNEIIQAGGTNSIPVTIGATILAGMVMSVLFYKFLMPFPMHTALQQKAAPTNELQNVGTRPTKLKMQLLMNLLLMQKKTKTAIDGHFDMPQGMTELSQSLGVPPSGTKDMWGTLMEFETSGETIMFRSAGPDKTFGTEDDVTLASDGK